MQANLKTTMAALEDPVTQEGLLAGAALLGIDPVSAPISGAVLGLPSRIFTCLVHVQIKHFTA